MKKQILDNAEITSSSKQIAVLKQHFPACFDKDGKFLPDKLTEIARAEGADISREGYSLNWLGKSYARLMVNLNTETLLAANTEHNTKDENKASENILIQGDNLDVLKHLKNAYAEQIKMIYIDPPYNTGSDGFAYQDDRKFTVEELAGLAGIEEDEATRILDFTQSNSNSHSAWLTFIYPRLYIAKELLKKDGAVFISIDDNELSQLKVVCDEVFGVANFVAQFVWAAGRKNDSKLASLSHEYILCYARDKEHLRQVGVKWEQRKKGLDAIYAKHKSLEKMFPGNYAEMTKGLKAWYKELPDSDPIKGNKHYKAIDHRGVYFPADISWVGGGGPQYDVKHPVTKKSVKRPKRGWMTPDPDKMQEWIDDKRVHFGPDETTVPCIKAYLKDQEYQAPYSVFYQDGRAATKRLRTLLDGKYFKYPKDEYVLREMVEFLTSSDDTILDFFAGSGTTAHAVMLQNAADNGSRRHITVQIDEPTDAKSEAYKDGYETIFEITRKRILLAAEKIQEDSPEADCDFGFKEYKTIPVFDGYLNEADTPDQYTIFEGDKLSDEERAQLLLTWQVYDGLPLTLDLDAVDLAGYTAHQGKHILYCINSGLTLDHILKMLERIDTDTSFVPQKIVVFEYILSSKAKREIMEAVKGYNNRKQIELHLEIRL